VVFGLLAVSLSTQPFWARRSHGFVASLGVILCYYLLLTTSEALGKKGGLPPSLALWLPNLVLGSVGFILFLKTAKEKSFFL
jgi:lipopolysaccharide export system permease protein